MDLDSFSHSSVSFSPIFLTVSFSDSSIFCSMAHRRLSMWDSMARRTRLRSSVGGRASTSAQSSPCVLTNSLVLGKYRFLDFLPQISDFPSKGYGRVASRHPQGNVIFLGHRLDGPSDSVLLDEDFNQVRQP